MEAGRDIHDALKSEVLRAFVRGWCGAHLERALVVCCYLVVVCEGRDATERSIARQTGVNHAQVHRIIRKFVADVRRAQRAEESLGVPLWAWAASVLERAGAGGSGGGSGGAGA